MLAIAVKGLSVGPHTVTVQWWRAGSGTATLYRSGTYPLDFDLSTIG